MHNESAAFTELECAGRVNAVANKKTAIVLKRLVLMAKGFKCENNAFKGLNILYAFLVNFLTALI
jgi:hypothetical protein